MLLESEVEAPDSSFTSQGRFRRATMFRLDFEE